MDTNIQLLTSNAETVGLKSHSTGLEVNGLANDGLCERQQRLSLTKVNVTVPRQPVACLFGDKARSMDVLPKTKPHWRPPV